jgi:hypothetical protein
MKTLIFILCWFAATAQAQFEFSSVPFMTLTAPPIGAYHDITNGLVAWYPLAGDVNDHFGSDNGTAIGSPSYATGPTGLANTAISFNGTSQYVTATAVNTVSNYTVSFWINAAVNSGLTDAVRAPFFNGTALTTYAFAWTHTSAPFTKSAFQPDSTGTTYYPCQLSSTPVSGTWYMISFQWDGTNLKTYVNGSLNGTPVAVPSIQSIAGLLTIGSGSASGLYQMQCSMAGVRIYSRALSGTELATLYTNGTGGNIF